MEVYEGLKLMVIGMSTVIGFLCLLVLVMHGSAVFFRVYHRRFPEGGGAEAPEVKHTDRDLAIALAVIAHHQNRPKGA